MAVEVGVPEMGESISEVVLLEWLKAGGEYVEKGEPICVLETDKANVDLPAPEAGVLHPLKEVDASIAVGDVIARIEEGERPAGSAEAGESAEAQVGAAPEADSATAAEPPPETPAVTVKPSALSPAVRRLVQESGVDPSRIRGTGRGGRLIKQDVLDFLKSRGAEGDGEPAKVEGSADSAPAPSIAPEAASAPASPAAPETAPAPREAAPAPPAPAPAAPVAPEAAPPDAASAAPDAAAAPGAPAAPEAAPRPGRRPLRPPLLPKQHRRRRRQVPLRPLRPPGSAASPCPASAGASPRGSPRRSGWRPCSPPSTRST